MSLTMTACSIVSALFLVSAAAGAQTEGEAIRARVKDGQKVSITTDGGQEITGRVSDLSADTLSVLTGRDRATVPYTQIIKIDRPKDGLGNGALIGLGAGALLGVAALAVEDARCDPAEAAVFFGCANPSAGGYVAVATVMGGLGAALGVGIDALIRRDPQIYRRGNRPSVRVAPALGRQSAGGVVSVSW